MKKNHLNPAELDPLEDFTGDLFVNRHYDFYLIWRWLRGIPDRVHGSFALIGWRRTGKTAMLIKIFNQLYHEQGEIMPVFISFAEFMNRPEPINSYEFARHYFSGYIRSYLTYHYRNPELMYVRAELEELEVFAHKVNDEYCINLIQQYTDLAAKLQDTNQLTFGLTSWVINFPKGYAYREQKPAVMMVDEFQVLTNVQMSCTGRFRDLTNSFQRAAETHWAPLLVSGSSISLLVEEALRGMLQGRFKRRHLGPLEAEYAYDFIFRLGEKHQVLVSEELAENIYNITGGYPYSIEQLMTSNSLALTDFPSEKALRTVLEYELTNPQSELYDHYQAELQKYSEQFNSGQTVRKVMFWATKYPGQDIDVGRIAKELAITEQEVQDALERLYRVDIVQRVTLSLYQGPTDPLLQLYIQYNHDRDIRMLGPEEAAKDWKNAYYKLMGQRNHAIGKLAEAYVGAIMKGFDGRTVDAEPHFNVSGQAVLPKFDRITWRGGVIVEGDPVEVDLIGEYTIPADESNTNEQKGIWIVQVKYLNDRLNKPELEEYLGRVEKMIAEEYSGPEYGAVRQWFFCKSGYSKPAEEVLQAQQIYHSDRLRFNALAQLFGFIGVPA